MRRRRRRAYSLGGIYAPHDQQHSHLHELLELQQIGLCRLPFVSAGRVQLGDGRKVVDYLLSLFRQRRDVPASQSRSQPGQKRATPIGERFHAQFQRHIIVREQECEAEVVGNQCRHRFAHKRFNAGLIGERLHTYQVEKVLQRDLARAAGRQPADHAVEFPSR